MKKRHPMKRLCGMALSLALLAGCAMTEPPADAQDGGLLDPEDPVTVTIWTYYNGQQLSTFNRIVDLFNTTVGREQGIVVESASQGSVGDLEANVLAAVRGEVGADKVPNMFAAYVDTAYTIDQMGLAADLSPYLTQDEIDLYVDSYIEEGRFDQDGGIKIFPLAKSTEVLLLNDTAWQRFAQATGATYDDLSTMERLVDTAQAYYEWTDSLTPDVPNDGAAFFGRDAMANYMLVGAMQLGTELFQVEDGHMTLNFDRETVRTLWEHYYVPYIKGYFASAGRFRSDDIKTGHIIALVGSSSGTTFFPDRVVLSDTESYPIDSRVFPAPQFEGSPGYAVQQGAGMVVTDSSEAEVYASVQFLKWFTQSEHDIAFSTGSGYTPVTKDANDIDVIRRYSTDLTPQMDAVLETAVQTVRENALYTPKAFPTGTDARRALDRGLSDQAKADREIVVAALAQGATLEEACAPLLSEAHFEEWYTRMLEELRQFEG